MNETHPFKYVCPIIQVNLGNGYTGGSPTSYWTLSGTNFRQGTSCPNWRFLTRIGSDATTSFTGEKHTINKVGADAYVLGINSLNFRPAADGAWGDYLATVAGPTSWNTSLYTAANNKAKSAFWKKVREAQMQVSGLTFLGELREAVHMIRHPADALIRSMEGYISVLSKRKARNPSTKQRKRVLQDTWLEYSFGWSPLMNDIQNGLKAYSRVLASEGEAVQIRASGVEERDLGDSVGEISCNGIYFKYIGKFSQKCTVRYIASVRPNKSGPKTQLDRAMDTFGFRLDEFIPTAWELLPWSFFIDYFSNIGDVISANAASSAEINWACLTVRYSGESKYSQYGEVNKTKTKQFYGFGSGNFSDAGGTLGRLHWTRTRVERSPVAGVGLPALTLRFPGSPRQFVNLWALFSGAKRVTPYY
jgi:hypothetical protein